MHLSYPAATAVSVAAFAIAQPMNEKRQDFFTGFCGTDLQTCTSGVVGGKNCDPNAQVCKNCLPELKADCLSALPQEMCASLRMSISLILRMDLWRVTWQIAHD